MNDSMVFGRVLLVAAIAIVCSGVVTAIDCGVPPVDVANTVPASNQSIAQGEAATYQCVPGYTVDGTLAGDVNILRTCLDTGLFDRIDPCLEISCEHRRPACSANSQCVIDRTEDGIPTALRCECESPFTGIPGNNGDGCALPELETSDGNLVARVPGGNDFIVVYPDRQPLVLRTLSDSVDDNEQSINLLEESLSQVQNQVGEVVSTQISGVSARLDDVSSAVADVADAASANQGQQTLLSSAIESEELRASSVESQLLALVASGFLSQQNAMSSALSTHESKFESLEAILSQTTSSLTTCQTQGKLYDPATGQCQEVLLRVPSTTFTCNLDSRGVLTYDEEFNNILYCDGDELKRIYEPPLGSESFVPAEDCDAIRTATGTRTDGMYWVVVDGGVSQHYCQLSSDTVVDFGGDGSSRMHSASTCEALAKHFGSSSGTYWVNPDSNFLDTSDAREVECFISAAQSGVEVALKDQFSTFTSASGTHSINQYTHVTQSTLPSGSSTISVGSSSVASNMNGKLVMVIQMQGSSSSVGIHELALVVSVSGTTLTLFRPLKNTYESGTFDSVTSKSAQVVLVPTYQSLSVASNQKIQAGQAWNGASGGIVAFVAVQGVSVAGTIDASYIGFRGGAWSSSRGCNRGGHQGESWPGSGKFGPDNLTGGCCSGCVNCVPSKGSGYADPNGGGGGGGAGSCHGGGGGGASFSGSWSYGNCYSACRHSHTNQGWGQPECGRSGLWAYPGDAYGQADLTKQFCLGSGGGAGNAHSPSSSERTDGGNGGGSIYMLSYGAVRITGTVSALGDQGRPNLRTEGSGQFSYFETTNTQDGSGGAGSGGSIYIRGTSVDATGGSVTARGGPCGARTGWPSSYTQAQLGSSGSDGRIFVQYQTTVAVGGTTPTPVSAQVTF
eukprot:m.6405 g.6405  ORF g.6405 m.6405 type:complete len:904 (+) comp5154_c0_seq1:139-2850(+)